MCINKQYVNYIVCHPTSSTHKLNMKHILAHNIKDRILTHMSGNKETVKASKDYTDKRPEKPRWLSVRELNFDDETMLYLQQYTKVYTDGYDMINNAVTWLEMMRGYAIIHSSAKIDRTKHVSFQLSFDLQQTCKYELPAKHEIYMDTVIGLMLNDNFFREKARINRQKTLSEMHTKLTLAHKVMREWYSDYTGNKNTDGNRFRQTESALPNTWYPSDYSLSADSDVVTSGKHSKSPENVDMRFGVEHVYPVYATTMSAALAWLEKYLKPEGIASMPMMEAARQVNKGADPTAPALEDSTTDAEQAEMRSLLARLTQRYGDVMRDSVASLGAPLGVIEQVDQDEVPVAYRDIVLSERYLIPYPALPNPSVNFTIRVYENESLFDKLDQRRPFHYWRRINSNNPYFDWTFESPAGAQQTEQRTRDRIASWKQQLFRLPQGGDPPVLKFLHTDPTFLSMFQSRPKPRVGDAGAEKLKRRH